MYRCLCHYPKIDTTKIENFRRKYDFTFNAVRAHITIVFPCKEDKEEISKHVKNVLSRWDPFEVTLEGFTLSRDYWLFLTLSKGNDIITDLYKDLYQGILSPYRRLNLLLPHIGLGYFARKEDQSDFENYGELLDYKEKIVFDEQKYQDALSEAKNLNLVYPITIDEFTLVDLNKTFTLSKDVETILL